MTGVAVALAIVAAWCFALAARLQHHAVRESAHGRRTRSPQYRRLLRDRRWLTGLLMTGGGAVLHAAALALAPLTAIQPLGVLAVVITAVWNTREDRTARWLSVWPAVAATTTGAGAFAGLAASCAAPTGVPAGAELRAVLLVAGAMVLCAAIGVRRRSEWGARVRSLACATGGGAAFGLVSVLMRAGFQRVAAEGIVAVVVVDAVAVTAALVAGGWFVQYAYATGPPEVAMACVTVIDPLVAVGTGLLLLGESAGLGPASALPAAGCAALALGGVIALSLSVPPSGPPRQRPASAVPARPTPRNTPCPMPSSPPLRAPARFGSSSAPTLTRPTSTERPTSRTASPTVWPDEATRSM
ncbi:DMT family transporter [Streptomyces sp.]|uniref:DMT family transporter n=1 Tax=Streptomyces sp. TaxID=1931 RepID=UPI002D7738FC|nr:DMT family transporter [Streptomyces sp.]HET6355861.1 DMT family transporter [Streptomyces sp.]